MRLTRKPTPGAPPRGRQLPMLTTVALLAVIAGAAGFASGEAPSSATTAGQVGAAASRCALPGPYELPHGSEPVELDPADFSHRITNTYWPMRPGRTWTFREGRGRYAMSVHLTVLERTRMVRGIRARVIHDVVRQNGEIVENTFDWYAQDSGGSVWYLGEFSREYENGVPITTEGSWEYGVDGAQAGVLIPVNPTPGCRFRQEYLGGVAEDYAAVLSTSEDVQVPAGRFRNVLSTGDYVALEPWVTEHKFYARGVGPVLASSISPSGGREVLVATQG